MFFRLSVLSAVTVLAGASCGGSAVAPTPQPPGPEPANVTISCPQSLAVASPRGDPVAVVYAQPATSSGAPPITTSCTPASQALFPVGASTVSCTASDARSRTASCAFQVTVTGPPTISATRFLAFGDSLTLGETPTFSGLTDDIGILNVDPAHSYPTVLQNAVNSRYTKQNVTVVNRGETGESTGAGRGRLSRELAGGSFEVLLLLEGANDLIFDNAAAVGPAVNNMRFMVRDGRSRGLKVYLATLPPQNPLSCCPRRGNGYRLAEQYNDQLRSMAPSEGATLVDVYQAFGGDTTTLIDYDGLHPTALGYQRIAETFFKAISRDLEQPPALTGLWHRR